MKIAISGPAAAGKGTIARGYATMTGIGYVDLGLLFRLGAFALSTGRIEHLEKLHELIGSKDVRYVWTNKKATIYWQDRDITVLLLSQEIAHQTSVLASNLGQQEILTTIANCVLETFSAVVCDGRNAGTTILPNADYKFFITASLEERARRRHLDVLQHGRHATYQEVLRDIMERDKRDAERIANPMVIPYGAVILETNARSIEESIRFMQEVIDAKS